MKKLLIDTMIFEVTPTMLKEAKNQHGRFLLMVFYKEQMLKTKMVEFIQKIF